MNKLLRLLLVAASIVVVILLVAMIVLMTVIDPNDFKDEIAKSVHQHTGRTFAIEGDIHWRFFPTFGLQAKKITLGNAPGFANKPFAQLESAALELRLSRLIFGQVALGTLELKQGQVFLERSATGEVNWQGFGKPTPTHTSLAAPYVMVVSTAKPAARSPLALSISGLDIEGVSIQYSDHFLNTEYQMNDLALFGKDIQFDAPFYLRGKTNFMTPDLTGVLNFDGYTALYPSQQQYALSGFSLNGVTQFSQTTNVSNQTSINFDLEMDLANTQFELNHLEGTLFDNPVSAQLAIMQGKSGLVAKGCFDSPKLTWQKLSIESVKATVASQDGKIRILPITATVYEGALAAQVILEANNALSWHATGTLKDVNTEALTQALLPASILSGTAGVEMDFSGEQLKDPEASLKSINGTLVFEAEKGSLIGFDLQKLFTALMNQKDNTGVGDETLFDTLTGSVSMADGVLTNKDLKLTAEAYTAEGRGSLQLNANDFNQSRLEYTFAAQAPKISKDLPLAIRLYGKPEHIKVEPDLQAYLKALLKKQFKRGLFEQLNKGGKLPAENSTTEQNEPKKSPIEEFENLFDKANGLFR